MSHVLKTAVLGPMLVAISACGGGGNDGGGGNCFPPPKISSNPPTTATVGRQYAYWVDASYFCVPFVTACGGIDGVQLPPGAGIDDVRGLVYWTPAPSHAGTSVPFTIATEPDQCGNRARQSWSVSVLQPPVIESFVASTETVNPGASVELTAVFMGEGWIGGLGNVTSGVPVQTPGLASSTSYTLSVRNSAGAETSYSLWVDVIGPPNIQSLTATPDAIGMGASTTLRWSVSGQHSIARLDPPGIDVIGSSSIVVRPNSTTTYMLTLENALGVSTSASVQVEVVPPSAIFSFSAAPASTEPGGSVVISASFLGTGTMERESANGWYEPMGPIASGGTMDSGELHRSTAFRLSVRNALGQTTTQELVVPLTGPGTFQPAGGKPVTPSRVRHAATRLADGRVFISGGQSPVGTSARTTELYDPATDSFSAGPSLLEARSEHSATLLADGRVLIAGGRTVGVNAERLTAEIFDPATETVQPAGSLPGPAKFLPTLALALPDGRAVVVASIPGIPSQHGVVIYDPIANGFGAFIPFAVLDGVSAAQRLADGRGLFIRGTGQSEVFMPGPDSFALTGAVTTYRGIDFATTVLGDGRVLVTGGTVDPSTPAEIYDPGTGTFNVTGQQQFFAPRYGRTVALASGRALAVGGGELRFGTPWAELFDPAAGTFSSTGGLRTERWSHTATLLEDGRVLVVGGCSAAPCDAELYSP